MYLITTDFPFHITYVAWCHSCPWGSNHSCYCTVTQVGAAKLRKNVLQIIHGKISCICYGCGGPSAVGCQDIFRAAMTNVPGHVYIRHTHLWIDPSHSFPWYQPGKKDRLVKVVTMEITENCRKLPSDLSQPVICRAGWFPKGNRSLILVSISPLDGHEYQKMLK